MVFIRGMSPIHPTWTCGLFGKWIIHILKIFKVKLNILSNNHRTYVILCWIVSFWSSFLCSIFLTFKHHCLPQHTHYDDQLLNPDYAPLHTLFNNILFSNQSINNVFIPHAPLVFIWKSCTLGWRFNLGDKFGAHISKREHTTIMDLNNHVMMHEFT